MCDTCGCEDGQNNVKYIIPGKNEHSHDHEHHHEHSHEHSHEHDHGHDHVHHSHQDKIRIKIFNTEFPK